MMMAKLMMMNSKKSNKLLERKEKKSLRLNQRAKVKEKKNKFGKYNI